MTDRLEESGRLAGTEGERGDVAGGPTWPQPSDVTPQAPPVGLNWDALAARIGMDRRQLAHDGAIVLTGEYFPESGFAVDPQTFLARRVDVGDLALRPCYFLGALALREFHGSLPLDAYVPYPGVSVVGSAQGPVIGLFSQREAAERARALILQGSLGSDVSIEDGPLGTELRVGASESPGRVATVIAAAQGAVVAAAGEELAAATAAGPLATGNALGLGDAVRPGTGAMSDSRGSQPGSTQGTVGSTD